MRNFTNWIIFLLWLKVILIMILIKIHLRIEVHFFPFHREIKCHNSCVNLVNHEAFLKDLCVACGILFPLENKNNKSCQKPGGDHHYIAAKVKVFHK